MSVTLKDCWHGENPVTDKIKSEDCHRKTHTNPKWVFASETAKAVVLLVSWRTGLLLQESSSLWVSTMEILDTALSDSGSPTSPGMREKFCLFGCTRSVQQPPLPSDPTYHHLVISWQLRSSRHPSARDIYLQVCLYSHKVDHRHLT